MNRKSQDASITSASLFSFDFDSPLISERPSMKLQKTLFSVALAFAAASPAMAATANLTFNDLISGNFVTGGYGNIPEIGFTWATSEFRVFNQGATPTSSNSIYGPANAPGNVTISGLGGQKITNISFDYFIFSDASPQPPSTLQSILTWSLWDINNNEIDGGGLTADFSLHPDNTVHTFTWSGLQDQVTVRLSNPGQYIGYDNFSVTAVPEPGTYAMLLAGLAAVGFMVKRRSA